MIHNFIILSQIKSKLIGSKIHEDFFKNSSLNSEIDRTLKMIEKEEEEFDELQEEMIIHSELLKDWESITEISKQVDEIKKNKGTNIQKSLDPIKRKFYDVFRTSKSKLLIFEQSNPKISATILQVLDKKQLAFEKKLEGV